MEELRTGCGNGFDDASPVFKLFNCAAVHTYIPAPVRNITIPGTYPFFPYIRGTTSDIADITPMLRTMFVSSPAFWA